MKEVLEEENKIIKHEDHLDRVTTALFDKKTVDERDAQQLKELLAESDGIVVLFLNLFLKHIFAHFRFG